MKCLVILALVFSGSLLATETASSQDELKRPVLSALGRKRLEDNIRVLEVALRDLRENLVNSSKNIATLSADLKNLRKLEDQHFLLRKKYLMYLEHADKELARNEMATRDLAKWEDKAQDNKNAADPLLKDKMEAARLEQADRTRWKRDAEGKTTQVKELLAGIDKNLANIRSRRAPLQEQLALWEGRKVDYQNQITATETKKEQWEKMIIR
jgi:chromosome segregation ATPase